MADVKPFRAVRYNTSKVDLKKVIMPPYDIIRDVNEYYQRDPYNIVRIDKAREENREAPGIDKYARSGLAVRRWLEEGILLRDEKPLFYVYEQEYFMPSGEKKSMISFYASVKLEEFEKKIVLPHERTHSGPKADRLMLMRATNANTSPILSLYFDPEKNVHEILEKYRTSCAPLMQCVNDDGLRHSLWAISDPAEQEKIGFYMKSCQLFIADGHHRYETALNYRDEMRAKENSSGERPYDRIMMVLISMEHAGTSILPTHRLMKKFRRLDFAEDTAVKSFFKVRKVGLETVKKAMTAEDCGKIIAACCRDGGYIMELKQDAYDKLLESAPRIREYYMLSVSILHYLLFENALKMQDKEILENIDYTQDIEEAVMAPAKGMCEASFLVQPATVEEVKVISLNNEVMPQKSTYFLPKLATGFMINLLEQ